MEPPEFLYIISNLWKSQDIEKYHPALKGKMQSFDLISNNKTTDKRCYRFKRIPCRPQISPPWVPIMELVV